jgi:hypothetical protein
LDDWIDEVCDALGIEEDVDADVLLDVSRVVAHSVERRAAPVTTYLIGLAAARVGGDSEAAASAARIVTALANKWNLPPSG